jgi:hypothetical protein
MTLLIIIAIHGGDEGFVLFDPLPPESASNRDTQSVHYVLKQRAQWKHYGIIACWLEE